MIRSVRRAFWLVQVAVFLAASSLASSQVITPPPRPSLPPIPLTEDELLREIPESERSVVLRTDQPRERFEAWLDVSDMRLSALSGLVASGQKDLADELRIYEATLLAANKKLRSPAAQVRPRDKRFKNFEKRLLRQLNQLRVLVGELSVDDANTGLDVEESVKRLRIEALHSALDIQVLDTP